MAGLVLVIVVAVAAAGLFSFNAKLTSNTQTPPTPTPTEALASTSTPTAIPSTPPLASSTPKLPQASPTRSPQVENWVYPGSRSLGSGVYESSTDTDTITDWYRNKITSLGFNVRSFVKTSANSKVLNKLAAAKSNSEISVEISRNPGDSVTRIIVLIDN